MTQDELQKLRDLPVGEGLLQRLGITLSRGRFLCPAHADHTPSASISKKTGRWKCWSCGAGGSALDLTMLVLNKSFIDAARWLADEENVILTEYKPKVVEPSREVTFDASRYVRFFEHPWLSEAARKFLFEERMLDPRVVSWCRLTSWQDRNGVNWLQIPYYDMEGRLIGVQNRNLGRPSRPPLKGGDQPGEKSPLKGDLEGLPRFRFPAGCSQISMYNMPMLKLLKPGDECWIAEGSSDCWSLLSDHKKAIAIASATLLQPKDKQLLQEITARLCIRWRMAPDNDEPGASLFEQLQKILPNLEHVPLPEGCKDYSESYVKQKRSLITNH